MAAKKQHPLDALAQGDPKMVIALMLWKARHREPDMYVQIDEKDLAGFEDCVRYLKVKPNVRIFRPEGLLAQDAIPAQHGRRAVPARAATPPKPYVMVTLVDEKGDLIRPVENNEADFDAARDAGQVRKARDQAGELANRIVNQARTGEYSLSDIQDAANALLILSRAV
jgi:hypothetical protein